jgi:hypothetical protein
MTNEITTLVNRMYDMIKKLEKRIEKLEGDRNVK